MRRIGGGLTAVALLMMLALHASLSSVTIHVRTADLNRDGHPDVWEYYDDSGSLTRVFRDTNFDGRSDVEESYDHGHLVSRESDRNFDDRVDLIEQFDLITGDHVRSVVDADFDGTADLIVIFADGKPVFSKWVGEEPHRRSAPIVATATPSARHADDPLWSLDDPFSTTGRFEAQLPDVRRVNAYCDIWSIAIERHVRSASLIVSRPVPLHSPFLVSASVSSPPPRGPPALTNLLEL